MNQTMTKERYSEQIAEYRKLILNSLAEKEALAFPLEELKSLFVDYIYSEDVDTDKRFLKLLEVLFLPAAELRLRRKNKKKYIILSKNSEEDIKRCLSTAEEISYGKDKVSCIVCGERFDYFRAHEGDCENRYRLRGELDKEGNVKEVEKRNEERPPLPDSLVLCPSCLQKDRVQIGNKLYCRAGSIPKEAMRRKKEPVKVRDIAEDDSKSIAEIFNEVRKLKQSK